MVTPTLPQNNSALNDVLHQINGLEKEGRLWSSVIARGKASVEAPLASYRLVGTALAEMFLSMFAVERAFVHTSQHLTHVFAASKQAFVSTISAPFACLWPTLPGETAKFFGVYVEPSIKFSLAEVPTKVQTYAKSLFQRGSAWFTRVVVHPRALLALSFGGVVATAGLGLIAHKFGIFSSHSELNVAPPVGPSLLPWKALGLGLVLTGVGLYVLREFVMLTTSKVSALNISLVQANANPKSEEGNVGGPDLNVSGKAGSSPTSSRRLGSKSAISLAGGQSKKSLKWQHSSGSLVLWLVREVSQESRSDNPSLANREAVKMDFDQLWAQVSVGDEASGEEEFVASSSGTLSLSDDLKKQFVQILAAPGARPRRSQSVNCLVDQPESSQPSLRPRQHSTGSLSSQLALNSWQKFCQDSSLPATSNPKRTFTDELLAHASLLSKASGKGEDHVSSTSSDTPSLSDVPQDEFVQLLTLSGESRLPDDSKPDLGIPRSRSATSLAAKPDCNRSPFRPRQRSAASLSLFQSGDSSPADEVSMVLCGTSSDEEERSLIDEVEMTIPPEKKQLSDEKRAEIFQAFAKEIAKPEFVQAIAESIREVWCEVGEDSESLPEEGLLAKNIAPKLKYYVDPEQGYFDDLLTSVNPDSDDTDAVVSALLEHLKPQSSKDYVEHIRRLDVFEKQIEDAKPAALKQIFRKAFAGSSGYPDGVYVGSLKLAESLFEDLRDDMIDRAFEMYEEAADQDPNKIVKGAIQQIAREEIIPLLKGTVDGHVKAAKKRLGQAKQEAAAEITAAVLFGKIQSTMWESVFRKASEKFDAYQEDMLNIIFSVIYPDRSDETIPALFTDTINLFSVRVIMPEVLKDVLKPMVTAVKEGLVSVIVQTVLPNIEEAEDALFDKIVAAAETQIGDSVDDMLKYVTDFIEKSGQIYSGIVGESILSYIQEKIVPTILKTRANDLLPYLGPLLSQLLGGEQFLSRAKKAVREEGKGSSLLDDALEVRIRELLPSAGGPPQSEEGKCILKGILAKIEPQLNKGVPTADVLKACLADALKALPNYIA